MHRAPEYYVFSGVVIGASAYQLSAAFTNDREMFIEGYGIAILVLLVCLLMFSLSSLRVIRKIVSDEVWSLRVQIRDTLEKLEQTTHQNRLDGENRSDT